MNRADNQCWYHKGLTREGAEDRLKECKHISIDLTNDGQSNGTFHGFLFSIITFFLNDLDFIYSWNKWCIFGT